MSLADYLTKCRVEAGSRVHLKDHDPAWNGARKHSKGELKKEAALALAEDLKKLACAQELLYAANSWAVLLIFQAMDAAGKDSTIKHVMSGVNPQGCRVTSFKHPTYHELEHDFLWRCHTELPGRGQIGIFNRSYYEEVLIVKVHPELVKAQHIPEADPGKKKFWQARYEDINFFEQHLTRNGTVILKFFLNISREEQRLRFLDRVNDPRKHWKFSPADLTEREYWDDYQRAYEAMLTETSTSWAPWYIIPADHKWLTRALVANVVVSSIQSLDLHYPEVTTELHKDIEEARRRLEAEAVTDQNR